MYRTDRRRRPRRQAANLLAYAPRAVETLTCGALEIVIDLRDLTTVNADAVVLLTQADGACRAAGAHLSLLIGGGFSDSRAAHVLQHSGLRVQSETAAQTPARPPGRSRRDYLNAQVWPTTTGRE